jgi:hypothetical protein
MFAPSGDTGVAKKYVVKRICKPNIGLNLPLCTCQAKTKPSDGGTKDTMPLPDELLGVMAALSASEINCTVATFQDAVQKHPEVFEALLLDCLQERGPKDPNGDDPRGPANDQQ